jgi:hypothetical protein
MYTYRGDHMDIHFSQVEGRAILVAIEPHPETYLRPGAEHLVRDINGLLSKLSAEGVREIIAVPDRSATRLTLEEAGFRGEGVMRYAPDLPPPTPTLDMGRPGGFGPDTLILLDGGASVPAAALSPGVQIADGGRVEEIMMAQIRQICLLEGQIYGPLNRVRTADGGVVITTLPGAVVEETTGTDMIWLVTQRSRVRAGGYLFEDMWGSAALRQTRRISQAEVIAALNASEHS